MHTTRVACGQFEARAADKAYNLDRMHSQMGEAAGAGCAVIVFPELIVSGYLAAERIPEQAEPVPGPAVARVQEDAAAAGIAVAFGMAEQAPDGTLYDSLVVVDGAGTLLTTYRKLHLFGAEISWAAAGDTVPVFSVGGVAASGWICFDTRFPELARCAAAGGAELALVPTAWLGPPAEWGAGAARACHGQQHVRGRRGHRQLRRRTALPRQQHDCGSPWRGAGARPIGYRLRDPRRAGSGRHCPSASAAGAAGQPPRRSVRQRRRPGCGTGRRRLRRRPPLPSGGCSRRCIGDRMPP